MEPAPSPSSRNKATAAGFKNLIRVGLLCRCPACGQGPLFEGYLMVSPACAVCGLDLRAQDSGDGPAVFLIFILGFILTPLAIWSGFVTSWPLWVHALVWGAITLASILVLLRPSKALTIALQYRYLRRDGAHL